MDDENRTDTDSRLLHLVGRRPRLPESEVAPLREEAREVFRRQARKAAGRRRLAWAAGGAGLAAAILLLVAGPFFRGDPSARSPIAKIELRTGDVRFSGSGALLPGTVVTTAESGRIAVRLPAGASVRIDGNSSVRFDSGHALTLERGALYADVGPRGESHEGIEIGTAFGTVRDIGTQFEVRLLPEGGLRVRVREGKVRIDAGRLREAEAGSELLIHADGRSESADVPVYGQDWDWVQRTAPPFTIENASLADFLDWVSRETGLRWRLAEPGADPEAVILHGSIAGLTAEEALSVVLPGSGYRHRIVGGEIQLEKAVP